MFAAVVALLIAPTLNLESQHWSDADTWFAAVLALTGRAPPDGHRGTTDGSLGRVPGGVAHEVRGLGGGGARPQCGAAVRGRSARQSCVLHARTLQAAQPSASPCKHMQARASICKLAQAILKPVSQ